MKPIIPTAPSRRRVMAASIGIDRGIVIASAAGTFLGAWILAIIARAVS